jgi:nitrite reductase (NADH) large subunit
MFEAVAEEVPLCGDTAIEKILILGSGIAGVTAAEEARKCSKKPSITLISKEPGLPYYRLNLTRLLAGEVTEQDLLIQPLDWFNEKEITLVEGEALLIDRPQKQVQLRDGRLFNYDKLVLTTGSHPFVPPISGATREGVHTLRTLSDARQILERLQTGLRVVCVGGGLLGLETAGALSRRGAKVTVLEGYPWLMPRQLPQQAAILLQKKLAGMGIEVICAAQIQELAGDEHLRAVLLADGREIPADLAVISAGVRPNSCLARQAELKVQTGLIVDDRMTTNDPNILSAGDLTEHRGILYGIWPASYAQGVVAGINAAGGSAEFPGLPLVTRIKVVDVELFSVGQLSLTDASYRLVENTADETYCGLICRDNHLLGAVLFGDTSLAGVLKEAIEKEVQLPELPQLLERFPQLAG